MAVLLTNIPSKIHPAAPMEQIVGSFELMPAVILTSKLCPKGMEATVYALLAGFQNFGHAISRSVGVYFIEAFGIKTTAPCDFSNLAYVIMVSHMVLPLLSIPLTFVLLPKERMTDKLDVDAELRCANAAAVCPEAVDRDSGVCILSFFWFTPDRLRRHVVWLLIRTGCSQARQQDLHVLLCAQ